MKSGDIIFIKGNNLISRLIRFFDKGKFSHVAIAISPTHILEAQRGIRTRITPFYFDYADCEIIDLNFTSYERELIEQISIEYINKKYDYLQILGMLLKGKFSILFDSQDKYVCSEIVHDILKRLRHDCHVDIDLTPNELYEHLKEWSK